MLGVLLVNAQPVPQSVQSADQCCGFYLWASAVELLKTVCRSGTEERSTRSAKLKKVREKQDMIQGGL